MSFSIESDVYNPSVLTKYESAIKERTNYHLGYPYNLSSEFPKELLNLVKYSINNLGDPFIESNYGIHSRAFEIAVLDWFADLWSIPRDDYWGYIGCSGTEGNFEGLLIGRENHPNGILFASEDSHYSIFKAAKMYKIPYEKVKSNDDGSMDLTNFIECLKKYPSNTPAILNVNIGTTLKGSIDDVDTILEILKARETPFYVHCDGALSGIIAMPQLTFQKQIHSISVSGHKFLGCPFPCGVIITRKELMTKVGNDIDYISSRDTTIMGSRNGHSPIFMWYLLTKKKKEGLMMDYAICVENAKYLQENLKDNVILRNGVTVVLKKPICQTFIKHWQLACSDNLCHVVVMPNITKQILDKFIHDYNLTNTIKFFEI